MGHGGQRGDLHGANVHAGKGFGTGLSEMLRVEGPDAPAFRAVPGRDQVAVVGKGRAEEGTAVYVVRTYLQAQSALQTGEIMQTLLLWNFCLSKALPMSMG